MRAIHASSALSKKSRDEYLHLLCKLLCEKAEINNFIVSIPKEFPALNNSILLEIKQLCYRLKGVAAGLKEITGSSALEKSLSYLKSSVVLQDISAEKFAEFFNELFIALPGEAEDYSINPIIKEKVNSKLVDQKAIKSNTDSSSKKQSLNTISSRYIYDVSVYGNNCGLFALVLGTKIAFAHQTVSSEVYAKLDFMDGISINDLQYANFETKEISSLLRTAISAALKNDQFLKKRRFKPMISCCTEYLSLANKLHTSKLAAEMEAFTESNKAFLHKLHQDWKILEIIKENECYQFLSETNLINIASGDIEACYNSLLVILSQINKQNATKLIADLFKKYIDEDVNIIKKLSMMRKLYILSRNKLNESQASPESRKLLHKTVLKYFHHAYNKNYTATSILTSEKFNMLIKFAIIEILSFDDNGMLKDDCYNMAKIKENCRELFSRFFVTTEWDKIFQNYCNYIEYSDVMITADEIGSLAKEWNVQLEIEMSNNKTVSFYNERNEKLPHVKLCNPSKNHWQVLITDPELVKKIKANEVVKGTSNIPKVASEAAIKQKLTPEMEILKKKPRSVTGIIFDQILGEMTSSDLESRIIKLSHYLRKQYPAAKRVALFLPQSIDYIACFYALHAAGMAVIPLSPDGGDPTGRLADFIKNGQADLVITNTSYKLNQLLFVDEVKYLPICYIDREAVNLDDYPEEKLNIINKPDDLAYIVNTSGTSGAPKQILMSHRGIAPCIQGHIEALKITSEDRIAAFADVSFDAHIIEMGIARECGANLFIVPPTHRRNIRKLAEFYKLHRITVAVFVASMLRQCEPNDFPDLRVIICTGEKMDDSIILKWGNRLLVDGYGPAENTVATWLKIIRLNKPHKDPTNIDSLTNESLKVDISATGNTKQNTLSYDVQFFIIPGTQLFLLKEASDNSTEFKSVDVGMKGEIFIHGPGLALGYADPNLTKERFLEIPHPNNKEQKIRIYRTKDLGIQHADGSIEIAGRLDNQVKVYGKLICSEEISAVIQTDPNIAKVHINPQINEKGHPDFEAYLELKDNTRPIDLPGIYEKIETTLGQSFIPANWITVEKLPTLSSEKTIIGEKSKLVILEVSKIRGKNKTPLLNELEIKVAKLFSNILGINDKHFEFFREDNFFYLGGKSLQVIILLASLNEQFGMNISYEDFKLMPTIEQLARIIHRFQHDKLILPMKTIYQENTEINNPPVFYLYSIFGNSKRDLDVLKKYWQFPYSLYAISSRGVDDADDMDDNIIAEAYDCYQTILHYVPRGLKIVTGWSRGGILALLVKHFAEKMGDISISVLMIDTESPLVFQMMAERDYADYLSRFCEEYLLGQLSIKQLPLNSKELALLAKEQQIDKLFASFESELNNAKEIDNIKFKRNLISSVRKSLLSNLKFSIRDLRLDATLVAANQTQDLRGNALGWPDNIKLNQIISLKGSHHSIMFELPGVKEVANVIHEFADAEQNSFVANKLIKMLKTAAIQHMSEIPVYVPSKACYVHDHEKSFDVTDFILQKFFKSEKKVLLLLGEAGVGKTTLLLSLARQLHNNKTLNNVIILYLALSSYDAENTPYLIEHYLRTLGLSDVQIAHVKKHCHFKIFLDEVDENDKGLYQNLFALYNLESWNAQFIACCKSTYLINVQDYRRIFWPIKDSRIIYTGLEELMMVPFDDDQIERFIHAFLVHPPEGMQVPQNLKDPQRILKLIEQLRSLKEAIRLPFFLDIFMKLIISEGIDLNEHEKITADSKAIASGAAAKMLAITHSMILDAFVINFWDRKVEKLTINKSLPKDGHDIRIDIEAFCIEFAQELKLRGITKVTYKRGVEPWERLLGSKDREKVIVREGGLLKVFGVFKKHEPRSRVMPRRGMEELLDIKEGSTIGFSHEIFGDYFSILGAYNEILQLNEMDPNDEAKQNDITSKTPMSFAQMLANHFIESSKVSSSAFFKTAAENKETKQTATALSGSLPSISTKQLNSSIDNDDAEQLAAAIALSKGL